jgi:cation diffusion facilitator CzcD-associated flavoprotein CzcO
MPPSLRNMPESIVTHSSKSSDPQHMKGKDVTIIGSGASSIDLGVLLHENGSKTRIITRKGGLRFHEAPKAETSWWEKVRHPSSGIGPGLRSRLCTDFPHLFRLLPEKMRVDIVRRHLGPAAGWPMKARTAGVEVIPYSQVEFASENNGRAVLVLRNKNGDRQEIETDHVICATGYRPDMNRLTFLAPAIREKIATEEGSSALSANFESSVPGLYFLGLSAAVTFGPTMRFVYGADYSVKHLVKHLKATQEKGYSQESVGGRIQQDGLRESLQRIS